MEQEVITTGTVERGKLHLRHRERFLSGVRALRGEVEIVARRKRATRSDQQNRYWWGCCVELVSEHTGYTPDEVHELAKQMFLPKKLAVTDGNGEIKGEFVIGGTTTRLNKVEFGEFVELFRRWAATELGVVIPDPE